MTLPVLFNEIPAWIYTAERECLVRLASDVPKGGLILEVGCLYGSTSAALALAAPKARLVCIDEFSWSPEGYGQSSAERTRENLAKLGIKNATIIQADSRQAGKTWNEHIDLCWLDGGHSFEFIYSDLYCFGPHSDVIACHDYKNPAWQSIEKAVETFIAKFPEWKIAEVVETLCVLRKV